MNTALSNTTTTRQCYECRGTMEGRKENFRYTECGLSSVILVDVLVYHCKCGAIVPEIPAVEDLHEQIMLDLLRKDTLLIGEEIRFLRKMARYSATKLAKTMGIAKETISRWENDKQAIGSESDRLIRFACVFAMMRQQQIDEERGAEIEKAFDLVKQFKSLNLPEVLEKLQERSAGPMQLRINPETLAQYGGAATEPSSEVIQ